MLQCCIPRRSWPAAGTAIPGWWRIGNGREQLYCWAGQEIAVHVATESRDKVCLDILSGWYRPLPATPTGVAPVRSEEFRNAVQFDAVLPRFHYTACRMRRITKWAIVERIPVPSLRLISHVAPGNGAGIESIRGLAYRPEQNALRRSKLLARSENQPHWCLHYVHFRIAPDGWCCIAPVGLRRSRLMFRQR